MAANSDGNTELTTVVTCEGDLTDPRFPAQFKVVVDRLNGILGDKVKVHKLEPWNSVRVTLSIPREAALRLRQLANEGSQQLRALGILSVQVEGDQVISLRLATGSVNSEPQEIILRTAQDAGSSGDRPEPPDLALTNFLPTSVPASSGASTTTSSINATSSQVQFKSPNVVCPVDSVVPPAAPPNSVVGGGGVTKAFAGPFPFASMNQAMHCGTSGNRELLPPPYPGGSKPQQSQPPVTISSPLLVNLLQNDGAATVNKESVTVVGSISRVAGMRGSSSQANFTKNIVHNTMSVSSVTSSSTMSIQKHPIPSSQTNVLLNTSISPSALSTNTSIRQSSSTILTSTTGAVNNVPPPQYHRAVSVGSVVKQQSLSGFQNVTASTTSHNNSISQNATVSSEITLPVQKTNTLQQPSLSTQQANVYQSQPPNLLQSKSTAVQPSGSLSLQQNTINNSPLQANMAMQHPKLLISQKNSSLPQKNSLLPANIPLPKNVTIPIQQKNVQNNVLNQSLNNVNNLQLKASFQPNTIAISKSNNYLNQSAKMSSGNYPIQNSSQILSQAPTTTLSNSGESISTNASSLNNVMLRSLPSPPPYSVAISRPWDTLVHNNSLMDLTPTLTDLKVDDLDELLPTLELTQSPLPDLPEDFLAVHSNIISTTAEVTPPDDNRKFLINPLTGELEPQSSSESDTEEMKDVFTGLPSPAALSDEDTCSTTRPDTTTDQSDSETRLSDTNKPPRLKNSKIKDRGRDSPALKPEKIKLRLKLEKSEPINPAYKVDVSFINTQPKKASASMMTAGEELRVPPLHISLRGRNSIVIKNKTKRNADGTPAKLKVRKSQEQIRLKKTGEVVNSDQPLGSINMISEETAVDQIKAKMHSFEQKKIKKLKSTHDGKDLVAHLTQDGEFKSKYVLHNHHKDKQKERRGSDSDLVRNKQRYVDNGIFTDEKKRRLSQAELDEDGRGLPVLGSTNVGTITSLPQKPRKEKVKVKDLFKKDVTRNKVFTKSLVDKLQGKVVALPTAGEMDMEAKFKQGLMEGSADKGVPRPPHRTELVNRLSTENSRIEKAEKIPGTTIPTSIHDAPVGPTVTSLPVENSPPPDSAERDVSDRKTGESIDKPAVGVIGVGNAAPPPPGGRSPANGGGQGEDSGIESMDALSEKSPNQASQSPHADLLPPPKTQVPNMLDIEAQLAKMEGLNGDDDHHRSGSVDSGVRTSTDNSCIGEDVNENHNKIRRDNSTKLKQCCELTCALQDNLIQGSMSLSTALTTQTLSDKQQTEVNLVPLKVKKEDEDLEPLPVRVTPALYTYSNPEKSRGGSESPSGLSDEDSNSCSTSSSTIQGKQSKSLLEQLLIEIPNDHQGTPSSPSPATRLSVRTRALSKLGSPELSSPMSKNMKIITAPTKRKRNESDSSNHSVEEPKKKTKKVVEGLTEMKTRHNDFGKINNLKKVTKVQQEESSDSDEPLIEKVRKPVNAINTQVNNTMVTPKAKVKSSIGPVAINKVAIAVNTRRSVRSNMPAQNTRSKGDKVHSESEALRRKTRSAVSDVESKRKKEVK